MEYYSDDLFSNEHEENIIETKEGLSFTNCDKMIRASEIVDRMKVYIDFNGLNMLTSDNVVLDLIPMMNNEDYNE